MILSGAVLPEPHSNTDEVFYLSRCSFEGNGEILSVDEEGTCECLWQLTTLHPKPLGFCSPTYGVVRDPGCSFSKRGGDELFRVTREWQLPLPRFAVTRGAELIYTLSQRSFLLNRYHVDFPGGARWVFQMPLFSVHFLGTSNRGTRVEVREWTKRQWYIRMETQDNDPALLCALAFIHRERLRFA